MTLRAMCVVMGLCGVAMGQGRTIELVPTTGPATAPATGPTTGPGTRPATRPVTRPATAPSIKISPEAKTLLDQLSKAYIAAKSLEMAGTISADIDVAGKQEKQSAPFTAVYESPLKFRHDVPGDMLAGFGGEKAYMFKSQPNMYKLLEMPKDKPISRMFPPELGRLLQLQNPSLLLALVKDPAEAVKAGVEEISKSADVTVDGVAYPALKLISQKGLLVTTLLLDPKTNLLKRATFDITKDVVDRGAPDTKIVAMSVDYSRTVVDAPIKGVQFAWTPPAGARDAGLSGASAVDDGTPSAPAAANSLVGKAAPDFKLTSLDGNEISLEQLKGSVVVVTFWSVGAGPSAAAMPKIQKVLAEKAAAGVKGVAVNVKEDRGQIRPFVEKIKPTMPIVLDDGTLQTAYGAEPLPITFVIDKDGVVRKVVAGSADDMEQQVRDAVQAALAGK